MQVRVKILVRERLKKMEVNIERSRWKLVISLL